jgi:DNA-directed RNA polymerase
MKSDDRRLEYDIQFVRTYYADVQAALKAAMASGQMKPAVDAVNAMQRVPWVINERVLEVIRDCHEQGIEVEGLPAKAEIPKPPYPRPWDEMTELEQRQWRMKAHDVVLRNHELKTDRLSFKEDMETAKLLLTKGRFYTPMNCDFRGRVYATCHFNFQREDRVRALFLFAEGQPIGEEGLYWLKVHVANCGAFGKIDKRPISERVEWTNRNLKAIKRIAMDPMKHGAWRKADNPFLFLAGCLELAAAIDCGSTFRTCLPVSFDGACSGLQHLSLITRDEDTAKLVNLTATEKPQDVYSAVSEVVKVQVEKDVTAEHFYKDGEQDHDTPKIAQLFLDYGVDRKLTKRNVMTFSYSAPKYGMAQQQQTDLMDDLRKKVIKGELKSHPFDPYHRGSIEQPSKAARYISSRIFDAIEARIEKPAQVMRFLQSIAKALAHESKPVSWTTPVGIPFINRYNELEMVRLKLYMHDRGVRRVLNANVTTGNTQRINKRRAANAIAPNLVHSLDAAHLMLTVNAAVANGILQIATVHDSFGCLAPQAAKFNKIIRAELVRMYETHDVLSEVLEQAKCDLTQHNHARLPAVPQSGTLNLKEIENAEYAFA